MKEVSFIPRMALSSACVSPLCRLVSESSISTFDKHHNDMAQDEFLCSFSGCISIGNHLSFHINFSQFLMDHHIDQNTQDLIRLRKQLKTSREYLKATTEVTKSKKQWSTGSEPNSRHSIQTRQISHRLSTGTNSTTRSPWRKRN
jgi:hypothetical protein